MPVPVGKSCTRFVACMVPLFLAACSFTPEYKKPVIDVPSGFKEASSIWIPVESKQKSHQTQWWGKFHSSHLNALMEQAVENNLQISAATARYDTARSFLQINESLMYPQITLAGASTNNRQSAERPLRGAGQPDIYKNNFLYASASYEIDFWGKIRASVESSSSLADAAREDLELIKLLVQTNVAGTYFTIAGLDAQIQILNDSLAIYNKRVAILRRRAEGGADAPASYLRAQAAIESETLKLTALKARRAQFEHLLAILVGVPPAKFALKPVNISELSIPSVPISLPSTLLERRPDVLAAERRVAAANADIGIAKSAYYPSISLSGQSGFQNSSNGVLIDSPNRFWSIGPALFATIFDGGRIDGLVNQAVARHREAEATYKSTVLNSFREVEDLLVDLNATQSAHKNIEAGAIAAMKNDAISRARYENGAITYLDTVETSLQKLQFESLLAENKTQHLVQTAYLIKALGGWWN